MDISMLQERTGMTEPELERPSEPGLGAGTARGVINLAGGGLKPEMPDSVNIVNNGGSTRFLKDENKVICDGEGSILSMKTDTGSEVFAERAEIDLTRKEVTFTGNVCVFQGESITRGDRAVYSYADEEELNVQNVRTKVSGMILKSRNFEYAVDAKGRKYIEAKNASVTTEDKKNPNSWIRTGHLKIYPEDKVEFSHLRVYYKDTPFFYFPYFIHSLNPKEGYTPRPGMRSIWGPYLLNEYGILLGNRRVEKGKGIPVSDYLLLNHVDYRERRGIGLGFDFEDTNLKKKAGNMTGLSVYYVNDSDPGINPLWEPRKPVGSDRSRIALQQYWDFPIEDDKDAMYRLKANVNYLSDRYVLRDFFQDIYQSNDKPDNTVVFDRTDKRSVSSLLVRFDPNDFYLTDSRVEMSYSRARAPLFKSGVVYENRNSFSFMNQNVPAEKRVDIQEIISQIRENTAARQYWERMLNTDSFARLHSYHEISTSFKVANCLNLTPKTGLGYTGYYDVAGQGNDSRGIVYAACDFDMKFSKSFSNVFNDTFGVNTLRHVIQPRGTFSFVNATGVNPLVPQIDGWTSTTNPRSLDMGTFTAIDSLSDWAIFRYGVRNMLMTSRDGASAEWLVWDTFMDAYLHRPEDEQNTRYSNLYSIVRWSPLPWLAISSECQFPVLGEGQGYREYNHYMSWKPTRSTELALGHRYLTHHPILEDANQLTAYGMYRINENFAISGEWRWDAEQKQLQIQKYSLYRNVGAWYIGASLFFRDNGGKRETGFGLSFTLGETGDRFPVTIN